MYMTEAIDLLRSSLIYKPLTRRSLTNPGDVTGELAIQISSADDFCSGVFSLVSFPEDKNSAKRFY